VLTTPRSWCGRDSRRGFTLVELLVALAIFALSGSAPAAVLDSWRLDRDSRSGATRSFGCFEATWPSTARHRPFRHPQARSPLDWWRTRRRLGSRVWREAT
jgi:prepilin-type N-terminal cleavage/methylation domain-containing protein